MRKDINKGIKISVSMSMYSALLVRQVRNTRITGINIYELSTFNWLKSYFSQIKVPGRVY